MVVASKVRIFQPVEEDIFVTEDRNGDDSAKGDG